MDKKSLGFFYRMKGNNLIDEFKMYDIDDLRSDIVQVARDIEEDKENKLISKNSKPEIWEVILIKRRC